MRQLESYTSSYLNDFLSKRSLGAGLLASYWKVITHPLLRPSTLWAFSVEMSRRLSCLTCRSRKVSILPVFCCLKIKLDWMIWQAKCDRLLPRCSTCVKLNRPCLTPERKSEFVWLHSGVNELSGHPVNFEERHQDRGFKFSSGRDSLLSSEWTPSKDVILDVSSHWRTTKRYRTY